MRTTDWLILGAIAAVLYLASKLNPTLPATTIAPGATGPGGALLTLPPGLPSGQAAINAALGYDASGNPINQVQTPVTVLPSSTIGIGYVDLAPALTPSLSFDDGLTSDTADQGSYGLDPLPSYQTVPFGV